MLVSAATPRSSGAGGAHESNPSSRRALRLFLAMALVAFARLPSEARGGGKTGAAGRSELQSAPWASGEDGETERFLLEAEVVDRHELGDGVTRPLKVTLKLGDRIEKAVWKNVDEQKSMPPGGMTRGDDMYFSDRWQHDVAAYRLDRLVGLHRVPVTVIRSIDGRPGALQAWVFGAFSEKQRVEKGLTLSDPEAYAAAARTMRLFDALIYNTDRNQGNILITEPGSRMWLIDHTRAFRLRKSLPPDDPARPRDGDPETLAKFRAPTDETIRAAVEGLLTPWQIDGLLARRKKLAP